MSRHAELQVTGNFSFLRGGSHPDELMARGAALGLEATADRRTVMIEPNRRHGPPCSRSLAGTRSEGHAIVGRDKERVYDEYLAASARVGDRQALTLLAARWQPGLLRHAWRLTGDAELARDVAQEGWVDILRGIGGLDDAAAFPAWALRIVTRRAAKVIGRRQHHRRTLEALAREPAPPPAATDGEDLRADLAAVLAAIATLTPAHRAVLGLFYLEEMGVAEIAVALDVPPGTVKTRLMHARRKVRERLEGDDDV